MYWTYLLTYLLIRLLRAARWPLLASVRIFSCLSHARGGLRLQRSAWHGVRRGGGARHGGCRGGGARRGGQGRAGRNRLGRVGGVDCHGCPGRRRLRSTRASRAPAPLKPAHASFALQPTTHTPLAPGAPDIDALLALDGRPLLGRPVAALAPAPQPGGGGLRPLVRAAAPLPAREQPTAAHGRHPGRGARSGVAARALRGGGQRRHRLATRRLRADRPLGGARAAAGGDGRAHRVRGLAAAQRGAPAPHGARHPRDPVRRAEGGRLVGLRLDLGLPADHGVHVPGARAPPSPSLLPRRSRVPRVPRTACRSLPPSLPPHALP